MTEFPEEYVEMAARAVNEAYRDDHGSEHLARAVLSALPWKRDTRMGMRPVRYHPDLREGYVQAERYVLPWKEIE